MLLLEHPQGSVVVSRHLQSYDITQVRRAYYVSAVWSVMVYEWQHHCATRHCKYTRSVPAEVPGVLPWCRNGARSNFCVLAVESLQYSVSFAMRNARAPQPCTSYIVFIGEVRMVPVQTETRGQKDRRILIHTWNSTKQRKYLLKCIAVLQRNIRDTVVNSNVMIS